MVQELVTQVSQQHIHCHDALNNHIFMNIKAAQIILFYPYICIVVVDFISMQSRKQTNLLNELCEWLVNHYLCAL